MNYTENLITLGGDFPEITVNTTHGVKKLPQAYKGKWWILFSHPADFTPVCTTEFVSFAKNYRKFKQLKTELIGLSIDQVFSHIKWVEWIEKNLKVKIPFPIIADDRGELAEKLGMISPFKGSNTVRGVFIMDPKGKIRLMLYYPQEIGRSILEILRVLKALQTSDKFKVATPANWPENEIIKDHVIVPPAQDEKTAARRRNQKNCFDWWFCHKKAGR